MSFEEKQQYLRHEIMDNGYDTSKFYEFWQNKQLDLQTISLTQLQLITEQFKKIIASNQDDQFGEFHSVDQNLQQHPQELEIDWSFLEIKNNPHTHNDIKKQSSRKIEENYLLGSEKSDKYTKTTINKIDEPNLIGIQNEAGHELQSQMLPDHSLSIRKVIEQSKNQKHKCLQLQKNILDHHINVEITLKEAQQDSNENQENSGILKKFIKGAINTVTFIDIPIVIKTIGRNQKKAVGVSWTVTRKRADFQWLRKMLIKFYPGMVVPPIPNTIRSHQKMPGYLKKLEAFLLDTYQCPELRNSKYFEVFLSYGSRNDLQTFQKQTESASQPGTLAHVLNMKGELTLYFGQKVDYYSQNLQKYLASQSNHLKAVKNLTSSITEQYENIALQFHDLAGIFSTMSEQAQAFSIGQSDSEQQKCFPKLIQTYRQISAVIEQHSEFSIREKSFIENHLSSHFSYEKDRLDNMQNLLTKRDYFAAQFVKRSNNNENGGNSMLGKFTSLFGTKAQSLDIPSNNLQILKDQVGFYNSQVLLETTRCLEMMIKSYIKHFSNYGDSRIDDVDNMQQIWSKIMVDLSRLNIG